MSSLIVGTGWALGWLTLTVGHLNLLSATFAVMLKTLGRREALFSVALSVGVALGLAGIVRLGAELLRLIF